MPDTVEGLQSNSCDLVGYVVDNATPVSFRFVSPSPPLVGDYVVVEASPSPLLGLVKSVGTRSVTLASLPGVYDPVVVEKLRAEEGGDVFFECTASLLGRVDSLEMPRLPPLPGARVCRAPVELLRRVFGGELPHWISVGTLLSRPEIEVRVNVNKMVTRHTAILAVTGAGKSNTVAVIADEIARIGGTVLIFDFHGEYVGSSIGGSVNRIEAKINPRLLSITELMVLLGIEHRFYNQERILRKALKRLGEREVHGRFLEDLKAEVEGIAVSASRRREEATAAAAVVNKIEALMERYGDIVDDSAPDPVARLRPGRVNVIDLGRVDEDAADAVVSHVLRTLLWERKRHKLMGVSRVPYPILVVLEEAHILAPRDDDTLSKYWLSRIAREGRKFGLGLMLVSQRPKALDPDILGQANNLIVLRIVEPSDQRYIQEASESLSSDLVEQLPSLNVGEAVLVGPFVRVPALVKIRRFEGRLGGGDPDVVAEWRRHRSLLSDDHGPLYSEFL